MSLCLQVCGLIGHFELETKIVKVQRQQKEERLREY